MQNDEIEILGQHYSPTLRTLHKKVTKLYQKPIKIIEITGHVDDSIEVLDSEIVLRLHKNSTEDNVAHELMHAVLQAEGYPTIFHLEISPMSKTLAFCKADLDHIIINDRLADLGYQAHEGFLKRANDYDNVLTMRAYEDPNKQALFLFCILHQLIKFHYYIEAASAQTHILERFPDVAKHWQNLSASIDNLPPQPKPQDMWNIGTKYITLGDAICVDLGASIRISDLIGLEPLPLRKDQLNKAAKFLFTQSWEDVETPQEDHDWILLRTFLTEPEIMVGAALTWADSIRLEEINRLNVKVFLREGNIRYILLN
jgi:hypothetical protein